MNSAQKYAESIPAAILLALSHFFGRLNPPHDVDAEVYREQCTSVTTVHLLLTDLTVSSDLPDVDVKLSAPSRQSRKQKRKFVKWSPQDNAVRSEDDDESTDTEQMPTSGQDRAVVEAELLQTQWASLEVCRAVFNPLAPVAYIPSLCPEVLSAGPPPDA